MLAGADAQSDGRTFLRADDFLADIIRNPFVTAADFSIFDLLDEEIAQVHCAVGCRPCKVIGTTNCNGGRARDSGACKEMITATKRNGVPDIWKLQAEMRVGAQDGFA